MHLTLINKELLPFYPGKIRLGTKVLCIFALLHVKLHKFKIFLKLKLFPEDSKAGARYVTYVLMQLCEEDTL